MISVIMGAYNSADTLIKSIESVLNQTYEDFEIIICEDGSKDNTKNILEELANSDSRIKPLYNEKNMGLAYCLNKCIEHSKGEYIARHDTDDVCHPERFEKQLNFLKNHPEYAFVGASANLVFENEIWGVRRFPEIVDKKTLMKYNPHIHPTLIFRRECLASVNNYRDIPMTLRTEDYDLMLRLWAEDLHGYNMSDILLDYYENPNTTSKHSFRTRLNEVKVRKSGYKKMKLGIVGYFYLLKPIALLFTPPKLYLKLKNKRWKTKEINQECLKD